MLKGHLLLALFWILFGVLHSVFAALGVKQRMATSFPHAFKYYRLGYSLFAFLTFGLVLAYQVQLHSPLLYNGNFFTKSIGGIVAVTGLILMIICIQKYFLSLSGLKSLFQERPMHELMIKGIHRYVRHPLYLGTFLAIWGSFVVYPVLSLFISNFLITAYTLIGIRFEERKLIAEFGTAYKAYQQRVPKLLPIFSRKGI